MKLILSLTVVALIAVVSFGQSKTITKDEYENADDFAVRETNLVFPFVFVVRVETFKNGKLFENSTEVDERQAPGVERITKTFTKGHETVRKFQVKTGFGKVYCSEDGKAWTGPQPYECPSPMRLYGPREPETTEYTLEARMVDGQQVRVYREYTIFSSAKPGEKKDFRERISTIDARGLFIRVEDSEGTLTPRTVLLKRTQTWKLNAKFDPVVAPK
jgi:hypothetical protein